MIFQDMAVVDNIIGSSSSIIPRKICFVFSPRKLKHSFTRAAHTFHEPSFALALDVDLNKPVDIIGLV